MSKTSLPVIECSNLLKKYGHHQVLNGLTLTIPQGVIFALLGTNGAGKTTFIRSLLGLIPHSGGKIEILGEDPWQAGADLRQRIGYVSEEQGLYGWMKISQLVDFCHGLYPNWNQTLVDKYIQRFGLPLNKRIRTLSKGQKVRLALILALAPEPELLILDEPMSGLDPLAQHEFLQIIKQDAASLGHTIFFSTHDLHDVETIATHVAILFDGVIQISGPIEMVRQSVRKLKLPTDNSLEIPKQAVILEQDANLITYLFPSESQEYQETAAAGNSTAALPEPATLQEVFLYFCSRRDEKDASKPLTV